jgi:hypothetical protein
MAVTTKSTAGCLAGTQNRLQGCLKGFHHPIHLQLAKLE